MSTVPECPALDSRYALYTEENGALLVDERGHAWLEGPIFPAVLKRLTGRSSAADVAGGLIDSGRFKAAEVFTALVSLSEAGYLRPGAAAPWVPEVDRASLSADVVDGLGVLEGAGPEIGAPSTSPSSGGACEDGVPELDWIPAGDLPDAVGSWARELGVTEALNPAGHMTLVVVETRLDPSIAGVEAWLAQHRRPWLLVQPFGARPTVGPGFGPGSNDRWRDLVSALAPRRVIGRSFGLRAPRPWSVESIRWTLDLARRLAGLAALDPMLFQRRMVEVNFEASSVGWRRYGAPRQVEGRGARRRLTSRLKAADAVGGSRSAPASQTLRSLRGSISPSLGPLRLVEPRSGAGPMATVLAAHGLPGRYDSWAQLSRRLASRCAGKGRTPEQAEVSALAEALERYAGFCRPGDGTIRGRLGDLSDAIDPTTCLLISERQYGGRAAWNRKHGATQWIPEPFDAEARVDWTPLFALGTGRRRFLPRDWLFYDPPEPSRFFRADSNGCAAGLSVEEALLQGLLEVIERDAVAIWWYQRAPRPAAGVGPGAGEAFEDALRRALDRRGRDLILLDLTSDIGVPVAAAVSRHRGRLASDTLLGFGAHLDPAVAAERALTELCQFLPSKSGVERRLVEHPSGPMPWLEANLVAPRSPVKVSPADDLTDELTAIVDRLSGLGYEALGLDQSRPDVPLAVAKVVVPGLRPWWARFAPGRLFTVPKALGWPEPAVDECGLNPIPLHI